MPRFKRQRLRDIPCVEVPKGHYSDAPSFGRVVRDKDGRKIATVRSDLPPRIKRHVALHERVHIKYGGGEIKTNLISAALDPIGFINTAFATVRNKERIRYYINRIKWFLKNKNKTNG